MKDLLTERERKLKWYRENKEKISEARRKKRNKIRAQKGLPPIEEDYRVRDQKKRMLALAKKFIRARKDGDPDPGVSSPELEEAIAFVLEERRKKREYNKTYWKKYKAYLDERDQMILKMREENKEILSMPSITEMNIFDDDEEDV